MLNLFKRKAACSRQTWELSTPLLKLSPRDSWTIGDACMGTCVLGATGSGKTTGAGAALAKAFLRAGFGGLWLCCKGDERQTIEHYARQTGRTSDLVIFDASCQHRFSFLDEELNHAGRGAGLTENIVNLLSTILEVSERNTGSGGREDDGYWRKAMRQMCRNACELLAIAKGQVTVPDLYRVVVSAPTSRGQLADDDWKAGSFCFDCLRKADAAKKQQRAEKDFELVADYWMIEFPQLSEKTRSVIVSTFTSLVDVLNRSLLRDLFCTDTTIRPEDTLDGKIIVIDLPARTYADVGIFAAVLWKYCWQRAVERRDVAANERPVFLFADEFQNFSVRYDQEFQATARSSRAATVYLTQSRANMLAAFGGQEAEAVTDSLLGNLQTKFFHANGDASTNEWAANVIGRSRQYFMNGNQSLGSFDPMRLVGLGDPGHTSGGFSEQMDFEVQPREFTTLRCGGPANRWETDTIVFQGGRRFLASGETWMPVTFRQDIGPCG